MSPSQETLRTFRDLIAERRTAPVQARLLALDPGDTTGWATFYDGALHTHGQVASADGDTSAIEQIILNTVPTEIVVERYQIYGGKAMMHINSTISPARVIGGIQAIARQQKIPIAWQSASQIQAFWTSERLKQLGLYVPGEHARDAVRHGAHYLLFGG